MLRPLILAFITLLTFGCQSYGEHYEGALCIENITIIDAKNGMKANQTLIIRDGNIIKIADSKDLNLSKENMTVDGTGKFIIPGLWDAHIHFAFMEDLAPSMFDLFLAYGVTSVRDTGGQIMYLKEFKEESLQNPTTSPRVMIAGPLLDGMPNVYDGSSASRPHLSTGSATVEDIVDQVNYLDSLGVDLLKAYEMLTPEQFQKLTEIARSKELKVTGHVPLSMDVISASNAGLNSMEHMRNLELSCASNATELLEQRKRLLDAGKNKPGGELRASIHSAQRIPAVKNYDDAKANEVLQILAKNETWQIPTLALYRSVRVKENFKYLPDSIRIKWETAVVAMEDREAPPDRTLYTDWMLKMVGKIHDNEIGIMAGTDTPIGFLTPGLSLHEELSQLVESGLSPLDALKTATLNPAEYFNLESELGWIGENTWADLIILDANPLEDIGNTRQINAVIKQGNYYDRKKLDELLTAISER